MYGTTMRNYSVNKASKSKDERGIFSKFSFKKSTKEKKTRETRYLRIEKNEMPKMENEKKVNRENEKFTSKKEFPIPSVIITVLLTMMFLVVVSGIASL